MRPSPATKISSRVVLSVIFALAVCLLTPSVSHARTDDCAKVDAALKNARTLSPDAGLTSPAPGNPTIWRCYQKQAERGDGIAQYLVGSFYFDNVSFGQFRVPHDFGQARFWFEKAASQDFPTGWQAGAVAELMLGRIYQRGLGTAVDLQQALAWYQKSAVHGNRAAQYALGSMYLKGQGTSKDVVQGVAWIRKAADQGHPTAENDLGTLYYAGSGVPKDYSEAVAWFQKAAAQGNSTAQDNLGWMYQNGFGVARDYAQALALYQKAAAHDPQGENNVGWMYQHGLGVQTDTAQAMAWYQKAAAQGNAAAKQNLATLQQQLAQQQASARSESSEQETADEQANEAAQQRQETQDKIDNLNNEIQQLESDASDADQNADNLATNSNCTGGFGAYAQIAQQGCENINSIGVAKFRSEAAKDRNQADDDRAEIARLQGEEVQEAPHRDASFGGALAQQMQQNPQPSIVDTANQQAANMIALGAANDAARAQAAAERREQQEAEQQREQEAQQQAQKAAAQARAQAQAAQQAQQAANNSSSGNGNSGGAVTCTNESSFVTGTSKLNSDGIAVGFLTNNSNQPLWVTYTFARGGQAAKDETGSLTIRPGQTRGGEGGGIWAATSGASAVDSSPVKIYWFAVPQSESDQSCGTPW